MAISKEQRSNFKRKGGGLGSIPKKPKPSSWTQKFVCLACTDDKRVPTKSAYRDILVSAGLGEKKVQVPDVDCTTEQFYDVLMEAFPKLKDSGGFELMRCIPSTRDLELIKSPACLSPRLLRSQIGTARIYIRPIQADLDIEADNEPAIDVSAIYIIMCLCVIPSIHPSIHPIHTNLHLGLTPNHCQGQARG